MLFPNNIRRAQELCSGLRDRRTATDPYSSLRFPESPTHFCFRVPFPNGQFQMSFSCPIDASDDTFEMALIGPNGNLFYNDSIGYDDICRFYTINDVYEEILRLLAIEDLTAEAPVEADEADDADEDDYADEADEADEVN